MCPRAAENLTSRENLVARTYDRRMQRVAAAMMMTLAFLKRFCHPTIRLNFAWGAVQS